MAALEKKNALVTGGSRGIGRAIALRLAREGAAVAVHYGTNREAAEQTVSEITAAGGRGFSFGQRLGEPEDARRLFDAYDAAGGPSDLDILINNAGVVGAGAIEETKPEDFDRLIAVNLKAPYFLLQHALPRLRDGARIVNVSSGLAQTAHSSDPIYAASKAALDSLTRTLAVQLASRGITVNSVAPGVIDTEMNASWLDTPEGRAMGAQWSVFKRVGTPEHVADVVAFAASDEARWVTGSFLDATGGSLLLGG